MNTNITLTEEQKKNLQIFLARVELKGAEVNAFNDLVNALFKDERPEKPIDSVQEKK